MKQLKLLEMRHWLPFGFTIGLCTSCVSQPVDIADKKASELSDPAFRAFLHHNFDSAEAKYQQALQRFNQLKDETGVTATSIALAHVYEAKANYVEALSLYKTVTARWEDLLRHEKTSEQAPEENDSELAISLVDCLRAMAKDYSQADNNQEAKQCLQRAFAIAKQHQLFDLIPVIQFERSSTAASGNPQQSQALASEHVLASAFSGKDLDFEQSLRKAKQSQQEGDLTTSRNLLEAALSHLDSGSTLKKDANATIKGPSSSFISKNSARISRDLDALRKATCLEQLSALDLQAGVEPAREKLALERLQQSYEIFKSVLWADHPKLQLLRITVFRLLAERKRWDIAANFFLAEFKPGMPAPKKALAEHKDLVVRGEISLTAQATKRKDWQTASNHADLALKLAKRPPVSDFSLLLAYENIGDAAYFRTAQVYFQALAKQMPFDLVAFAQPEHFYEEAFKLLPTIQESHEKKALTADLTMRLASSYYSLNRFQLAETYNLDAAKLYESLGDHIHARESLATAAVVRKRMSNSANEPIGDAAIEQRK